PPEPGERVWLRIETWSGERLSTAEALLRPLSTLTRSHTLSPGSGGRGGPEAAPRSPRDGEPFRAGHGPLSLWFVNTVREADDPFRLSVAGEFSEELDPDRVVWAFRQVIARHPALRSTFRERDGELWQRTGPEPSCWCTTVEASGWGQDELRRRLAE